MQMQMEDRECVVSNLPLSSLLCPCHSLYLLLLRWGEEYHLCALIICILSHMHTHSVREALPESPDNQSFMLQCLVSLWMPERAQGC